MKTIFLLILFFHTLCFGQEAVIVDQSTINHFDNLDENFLIKAKEIKLLFRHASVGAQINLGLDCLQGTRTNPKECNSFPPYKYDRRNWIFQARGNSGWKGKIEDFVATVETNLENYDVFSFKFCYLDGLDELSEPCGSPFNQEKTMANWNLLKNAYETLERKYPHKVFVWWTLPLTQVGQFCTEQINKRIREYCKNNGKILFDIADLQCWDTLGNRTTNSQGWEVAFKGFCGEQKPDAKACHPNWAGSIRIAKAFWYLMTKIGEKIDLPNSVQSSFVSPNEFYQIISNLSSSSSINLELHFFNLLGQLIHFSQIHSLDDLKSIIIPRGYYFIKICYLDKWLFIYTFIE